MFGLGGLGRPIADRLAETVPVLGYDPAVAGGGGRDALRTASSAQEVAASCTVVLLCLPSPQVSISVVSSIVGLDDAATKLIVELSTIGITASAKCAEIAARSAVGYVDAPVSGSRPKAAAGDLTVMASGSASDVGAALKVLNAIASHVFVLGERPGLGQVMKLANNAINATAFAATCEAVVFGTRMGLDIGQMIDVLNLSTGRTSASTDKFPTSVLPRTFSFGASGEIVHKDAALFLEAAETVGLYAPVVHAAEALWDAHVRAHPEVDFTNLFRFVEDDEHRPA